MINGHPEITRKMEEIGTGLLRFTSENQRAGIIVHMKSTGPHTLVCVHRGQLDLDIQKNRSVNLVQRSGDQYLFGSGEIRAWHSDEKYSIRIWIELRKAAWYSMNKAGSVSWLKENGAFDFLKVNATG